MVAIFTSVLFYEDEKLDIGPWSHSNGVLTR